MGRAERGARARRSTASAEGCRGAHAAWPATARRLARASCEGCCPTGWSSTTTTAISRPGGTCWPPSSVRLTHYQARIPTRFADTTELPLDDALAGRAALAAPPESRSPSRSICASRRARRPRRSAWRPWATCSSTFRARTRPRRSAADRGSGGARRDATVEVRCDRPCSRRATAGSARCTEARVADESRPDAGRLVQPAVARRPARRPACGCCFTALRAGDQVLGPPSSSRATAAAAGFTRPGLVPVYPATKGLPPGRSARAGLADARRACTTCSSRCPHALRLAERLPDRAAALAAAHFPERRARRRRRARRLAFEELFLLELSLAARRARAARAGARARSSRTRRAGRPLAGATLPFELDGRPAARRSSADRRRPRARAADAAAADGRGRLRQDRGGAARDAARGRERRARRR